MVFVNPMFIMVSLMSSIFWLMKWEWLMFYICLLLFFLSFPMIYDYSSLSLALLTTFFSLVFFSSKSLILFFGSFELSTFPVILLLFGWGYQPEKVEATMYLVLYTSLFSFILLASLFLMIFYKLSFNSLLALSSSSIFSILVILAMLVKTPMFLFHHWLPKAHVEANTLGSIFLAGIILKLGTVGLLKLFFLIEIKLKLILLVFIGGTLYSSILTTIQSDVKKLVAMSSIVHMNFVSSLLLIFEGVFSMNMVMVFHSIISSGLFFLMGYSFYVFKSRLIYSIMGFSSFLIFILFVYLTANMGLPPLVSFVPEVFTIGILYSFSHLLLFILGGIVLIIGYYCLFLFWGMFHTKNKTISLFNNKIVNSVLISLLIIISPWFILM